MKGERMGQRLLRRWRRRRLGQEERKNAPEKKADELALITIRAESAVEAEESRSSGMRGSKQIFAVEHICSIHLNEKSARAHV